MKPASQTAYLTELVVRRIIESGILPEGSLQLLSGSAGDLLDHLGVQDSVAFTGSAHTAGILRQHPSVLHGGVTLQVEADSLNCSVLGPDVTSGDPEWDLFVKGVVTEMTAKAGQKCTAIRRVIVPAAVADEMTEAIAARLATITVGNPGDESVRMGPLASLGQREEVRKAVEALRSSADVVHGDPTSTSGFAGDAERGAFMAPVLLRARAGAVEPHDVEPFGPVSTVMSYDSLDEAVALAARGKGSLVGSVVTHDPDVARTLVLGLAPWHGRILVLDRDDAPESTGHGSPLPMLVHGGPGRAGGGEELGGMRAVLHHMQRSAIQASPDMLTAITGRWTRGSQRTITPEHPFRHSLATLRVGDTIATEPRVISRDDIDHFADFTGDTFYAHTDPEAAAQNPLFGGIVAHGYLIVSMAAGLFVDPAPGPVLANFGVDHLRFLTPVKAGDSIRVTLTVKQITPRSSRRLRRGAVGRARHQRRRRAGGDLRRADAGGQGGRDRFSPGRRWRHAGRREHERQQPEVALPCLDPRGPPALEGQHAELGGQVGGRRPRTPRAEQGIDHRRREADALQRVALLELGVGRHGGLDPRVELTVEVGHHRRRPGRARPRPPRGASPRPAHRRSPRPAGSTSAAWPATSSSRLSGKWRKNVLLVTPARSAICATVVAS